jgi:hypothetical protein
LTTIGTAVLQIIPSLKGVTDAIEKQIDGKVVEVKIAPKVDKPAVAKASRETGEAIAKGTKDAVRKADIGKAVAEDVKKSVNKAAPGKDIGKAVADDVKTSVQKASPGKEIAKSVTEDVKKASPGKDLAKVIVEGIADGVKQELPKGSVGEQILDSISKNPGDFIAMGTGLVDGIGKGIKAAPGIADALKDGIKNVDFKSVGDLISGGLKGGLGDLKTALSGLSAADISTGLNATVDALRGLEGLGVPKEVGDLLSDIADAADQGKEVGDGIRQFTEPLQELSTGSKLEKWAGKAGFLGDIVETGIAAGKAGWAVGEFLDKLGLLDGIREQINGLPPIKIVPTPEELKLQADLFGEMAGTLKSMPDAKTVTVDALTDDAEAKLKSFGFDVTHTDGQVKIVARTEEAAAMMDAWRRGENAKPLTPGVVPNITSANVLMQHFVDQWSTALIKPNVAPQIAPVTTAPRDPNSPDAGNDPLKVFARPPHRARGGQISGPGTGTSDSILAWLSSGEFVVNADATRKNLPLLEIINSGRLPGFAGGGQVGADVAAAEKLVGHPYSTAQRFDCSGDVARVINAALGRDGGSLMTTASAAQWLAALGFKPGIGGPGAISVGWKNGGPGGGHMAMTLSDGRNAEGGGSHPNFMIGGSAAGASSAQFTDHMYLALAAATPSTPAPAVSGQGDQTPASAAPAGGSAAAGGSGPLPTSISGLSSFGLDSLGTGVGKTNSGSDLGLFGKAAASAASGQVASALGVFGVGDTPPFLQAASKLIGGIKVSDSSGKSLFDGSNLFNFGQGSGGSAAPLSASSAATGTPPPDAAHGTQAGQQPGPAVVYNITARDTEDAFIRAQRVQNERAAAKLSVY